MQLGITVKTDLRSTASSLVFLPAGGHAQIVGYFANLPDNPIYRVQRSDGMTQAIDRVTLVKCGALGE